MTLAPAQLDKLRQDELLQRKKDRAVKMNMTNKINEEIKKETDDIYKEALDLFKEKEMKEEVAK